MGSGPQARSAQWFAMGRSSCLIPWYDALKFEMIFRRTTEEGVVFNTLPVFEKVTVEIYIIRVYIYLDTPRCVFVVGLNSVLSSWYSTVV